MYDINTKNVKKGKRFYLLFLFVGIVILCVIGGIIVFRFLKLRDLDSEITSTSIDANEHYDDDGKLMYSPIYYYSVDGNRYSCSTGFSSNITPKKSGIVYYDSKDPSNCMNEYSKSNNKMLYIFLILPFAFIALAVSNIKKVNKRLKLINELNQNGKLVKNLEYHLEGTGMLVNGVEIKKPVVDYTLPSDSTIKLYGDPRHDRKSYDEDGLVDLVIDENNPDNYFIDFEINRLTGNQTSDYYVNSKQTNHTQQQVQNNIPEDYKNNVPL